jgi:hypothetical protein
LWWVRARGEQLQWQEEEAAVIGDGRLFDSLEE